MLQHYTTLTGDISDGKTTDWPPFLSSHSLATASDCNHFQSRAKKKTAAVK